MSADPLLPLTNTPARSRRNAFVHGRCPRCRRGRIFEPARGWRLPRMLPYCEVCGLKYEREEGYFLGAMYISYGIALAVIALFAVAVWLATRASTERVALIAFLLFLPLTPALSVVARVLWIHFDRMMDP